MASKKIITQIVPASWQDIDNRLTAEYLSPLPAYTTLWPVYRPYSISERNGQWYITGDSRGYWQVWENRTSQKTEQVTDILTGKKFKVITPKVDVEFYNPAQKPMLLPDLLKIELGNHESVLDFVNHYGFLGLRLAGSPFWVTAQIPPRSFAVYEESLEDFFAAVKELKEVYELFKVIERACSPFIAHKDKKQAKTQLEKEFSKQETEYHAKTILLGKLRNRLAGIRLCPQLSSKGGIVDGWSGFNLLDHIWLQFYEEVKTAPLDGSSRTHNYRKCANCSSTFEVSSQCRKYCPSCSKRADARRKGKYAETRRKAVKMVKGGISIKEVALALGRSQNQVEKWVHQD